MCDGTSWFHMGAVLTCEFLAGRSSFICYEELERLDLEDQWTSVHCLWGL